MDAESDMPLTPIPSTPGSCFDDFNRDSDDSEFPTVLTAVDADEFQNPRPPPPTFSSPLFDAFNTFDPPSSTSSPPYSRPQSPQSTVKPCQDPRDPSLRSRSDSELLDVAPPPRSHPSRNTAFPRPIAALAASSREVRLVVAMLGLGLASRLSRPDYPHVMVALGRSPSNPRRRAVGRSGPAKKRPKQVVTSTIRSGWEEQKGGQGFGQASDAVQRAKQERAKDLARARKQKQRANEKASEISRGERSPGR
ncbi:hypothetical protein K438DRAFT_1757784 [Mycena galopus ATCC 62051]|nr:hypothetical protein K438DRAFT_1757784 [Mycena galopus ATCC 62051]